MSAGFDVVADQLRTLAGYFEDLEDTMEGFAERVGGTGVSGNHTGRSCPEAGDALNVGLQAMQAQLMDAGTRALDVRGALNATARNYDETDAANSDNMTTTGSGL